MNHFLQANGPFLLAFVAMTVLAVAIALQCQRFLRGPSSRHAVLLAAVLLAPVLFVAGSLGLRVALPLQPPGTAAVELSTSPLQGTVAEAVNVLPMLLFAVWMTGALVALARIAFERARWRGIAARAEVVTDPAMLSRFESPCVLARSAECAEPTVIGIADPVVVLPAAYDFEPAELDAVFAHELAHVDRRDNLTALAVQVVCALFWFDPLHRAARRTLVELRERICDAIVLECGCDAEAYVRALARSTQSTFTHSPAVACMSRLKLQERMESIMTHENRRRFPIWITRLVVTVAVAAAGVGFATFSPSPVLTAGEAGSSPYDFDVRVSPHDDGRFTLAVRIDTPEGPVSSMAVIRTVPEVRTISSTHGGKTYRVEVSVAADGSSTGKFDVTEGVTILASARKQFSPLPMQRFPLPPAPPRPGIEPETKPVSGSMKPPKPLVTVNAIYTEEAKQNRIAGIVIVEASIDETGVVTDARVIKPLPYDLDKAAVDAIRQWQFAPATVDGKPVPAKFNITMNFKLE